jgi:penicillin-binding protein 1A
MDNPFEPRKSRAPRAGKLLALDAWIDSSLYEARFKASEAWETATIFFRRFRVAGWRRGVVEILSDAFTFGAIGCVLITALAMPAFDIIDRGILNKAEDYSVVFLDRFGNEIGRRGIRSDDSVALDQMPDYLIKATLATEDRRFYEHFGVDIIGTLRALMTNATGDTSMHGGSSLTQQLAKKLFLTNERTIERKIKEAFLSIWLECAMSKNQILQLYLDRAYMGGGKFGIVGGADFYFGKRIKDLHACRSRHACRACSRRPAAMPRMSICPPRARAPMWC